MTSTTSRPHFRPNAFRSFGEVALSGQATVNVERPAGRPPRAKLRGTILALVVLPNRRQHRGAFHALSMSGGLLHVDKPLDEKIPVEIVFHLGENTIRETAVPLLPLWATRGWLQPFRFADLSTEGKRALRRSLRPFLLSLEGN